MSGQKSSRENVALTMNECCEGLGWSDDLRRERLVPVPAETMLAMLARALTEIVEERSELNARAVSRVGEINDLQSEIARLRRDNAHLIGALALAVKGSPEFADARRVVLTIDGVELVLKDDQDLAIWPPEDAS